MPDPGQKAVKHVSNCKDEFKIPQIPHYACLTQPFSVPSIIFIYLFFISTPLCQAEILTEYDKFEQITSIRTEDILYCDSFKCDVPDIRAKYVYSDVDTEFPQAVFLFFSTTQDTWKYLHNHSLRIIVDGKLYKFDQDMSHEGRLGPNFVVEVMGLFIPVETFIEIANANKVEMRLGTQEFSLKLRHLKAFRELAQAIQDVNSTQVKESYFEDKTGNFSGDPSFGTPIPSGNSMQSP